MILGGCFIGALAIALGSMQIARAKFARGIKSLERENPLAYISPDVSKFVSHDI